MKKNKILSIWALALVLLTTGCNDSFLDMNNYGAYDDFDSETKVSWYLSGLYQSFFENYTSPTSQYIGVFTSYAQDLNELTDETFGISSTSRIDPSVNYGTIDDIKAQSDASGKSYDPLFSGYFGKALGSSVTNNAYTRIRNCNILLRDIDASSVSSLTKSQAKGQALFLRAMQLFDLVRMYGPVPIVTNVINAEVTNEGLPRASVTQCVKQIITDLDEAAALLPDVWGTNDYGRLTRGGALAYKSRVLLFYASPLFNRDWHNESNHRWQQALAAAEEAVSNISGNNLNGVTNASDWGAMLADDDNEHANKEGLIVRLLAKESNNSLGYKNNRWEKNVRLSSQGGSGGKPVPLEFIDVFPMADGTLPDDAHKVTKGSLRFMENRDPRFYQTFAFNGVKWGHKDNVNDTVWAYRWRTTESTTSGFAYGEGVNISSPVFVRKMSGTSTLSANNFEASGIHIYEYRYAELQLNLAECYAATGQIDLCKQAIGKIRARVGIPADNNYGLDSYITDRASALAACLRERQVELAYEGKRYWDIWRWLLYDGGQNVTGKGANMQLSTVNTCSYLGVTPLINQYRTAKYVDVKDGYIPSSNDILSSERKQIVADPAKADFQAQLKNLADFWENNFQFGEPTTQPDKNNSNQWIKIGWKSNYYIMGLSKDVLDNNSWLGQTKGWTDQNGADGTIDWQDDESF